MSNFDRVLSEQELSDIFESMGYAGGHGTFLDIANEVQQAVLAKLAEQEPETYIILDKDGFEIDLVPSTKDYELKDGETFMPLYAHPMPCVSHASNKTACVSENGESETQTNCQGILDNSNHIADKRKMVAPEGYALVPVEITAEMLRDAHIRSELGAYAVSNLSEGYSLIRSLYDVLVAAAPKYTGESK